MRKIATYIFILLGSLCYEHVSAQQDSVTQKLEAMQKAATHKLMSMQELVDKQQAVKQDSVLSVSVRRKPLYDSATLARRDFVTDSILQKVLYRPYPAYSIAPLIELVEQLVLIKTKDFNLFFIQNLDSKEDSDRFHKKGNLLKKGVTWLPVSVFILLVYFMIIRQVYGKQLGVFFQAFYSNRQLHRISKEDNVFNSWLFFWMYLLFGFTAGMFLCLTSRFFNLSYPIDGYGLVVALSISIIIFFAVKILILRMIGFVFDFQKVISEYVSILYLTYFNLSVILIPIVLFFCFSPINFGKYYIVLGVMLLFLILCIQLLRAGINILSTHRLGKFYLLLYICALEICPILILIKALAY